MKALALTLLVLATSASADTSTVTYQGLTLGAPLPADITPRSSKINADRLNAEYLPLDTLDQCVHEITPLGPSSLIATSLPCDGPVIRISAAQDLIAFFNPDDNHPPVTTQIDGMEFKETTLATLRARFCSEGLVAPRWFGQISPDNVGAYALAYDLRGTDAIAAFWFQTSDTTWSLSTTQSTPTSNMRDNAVLVVVEVMTRDQFVRIATEPAVRSDGYVPIPNIFDGQIDATSNCPFS